MIANSVTPTFDQLGPYCVNSTPASLSLTSDNGVTGTWSPATINTSATGSFVYTFTPAAGQCGTVTTMTIVITNSVTPTFLQLGPYCQNETPGLLPLVSTNTPPLPGTWPPSLISTSPLGTQVLYIYACCWSVWCSHYYVHSNYSTCIAYFHTARALLSECDSSKLTFGVKQHNANFGTWSPAVISTSAVGSQDIPLRLMPDSVHLLRP
ncbi:MAG: hypothetical protein IPP49_03485 [Saprospiraceae bacterium]|nr:hypothetical protein [Saprospiraceae bacterium]